MTTKTINLRNLPAELVNRAKACAALKGISLKDFVVEAIARQIAVEFEKQEGADGSVL